MPMSHRIALGFLYVLLFLSFTSVSLVQPVASWLTNEFGVWAMAGGVAGGAR